MESASDADDEVGKMGKLIDDVYGEYELTEGWLREKYCEDCLDQGEIGEIVGCSATTIRNAMRHFGIEIDSAKRGYGRYHLKKDWLQEKYVDEGLSLAEVGQLAGCSGGTISSALEYFGIDTRDPSETLALKIRGDTYSRYEITEDWLREHYCDEGLTQEEVAEVIGCSAGTVRKALRHFDIPSHKPGPEAEDLTGERFGHLTVLHPVSYEEADERYGHWLCRCDCGTEVLRAAGQLRKGLGLNCGCMAQFRTLLYKYKTGAEERGLCWDLTVKEFRELTKSACHYCGRQPNREFQNKDNARGVYVCNGIDRVDNEKGYTPDNVVPCCTRCNFMKGDLTYGAFILNVYQIAQNMEFYERS